MKHKFEFDHRVEYREIRNHFRPIVMTLVEHAGEEYEYPMLVDTGANNVVLPASLAPFLGIDVTQLPDDRVNTFLPGVREVKIGPTMRLSLPDLRPGFSMECAVYFADFMEPFGYGLLGRDVLARFRFCFTHEQGHSFFIGFKGGPAA